uniref:THAP-type domain-containing protein n=1 Tax=Amphimedon queenslandica TaxID=400682 RepID=A0A1X7UT67_AMPQE
MGKNCVAAGCTNIHKSGVSLFSFPKDKIRNKWIKEEQKTRACWKGPSDYSCACSDHFTEDCFKPRSLISEKMGVKAKIA